MSKLSIILTFSLSAGVIFGPPPVSRIPPFSFEFLDS